VWLPPKRPPRSDPAQSVLRSAPENLTLVEVRCLSCRAMRDAPTRLASDFQGLGPQPTSRPGTVRGGDRDRGQPARLSHDLPAATRHCDPEDAQQLLNRLRDAETAH
jgi:hypothetical protein